MKKIIGYPSGAIIRVNGVEFSYLKTYDLIYYDDEPNYDLNPEEFEATDGGKQWRYDDDDETEVKRVISMARKKMKLKEIRHRDFKKDPFAWHAVNVAKKTLKTNKVMNKILGGPNEEEAKVILKKHGFSDKYITKLSKEDIEKYATDKEKKILEGGMHQAEFAAMENQEVGLWAHLDSNFYPPIPLKVKQKIMAAFKKYWAGELDQEGVVEYLDDVITEAGLFHYFGDFLG